MAPRRPAAWQADESLRKFATHPGGSASWSALMLYHFTLACGILCVSIWLYLLLAHGRFWRVGSLVAQAPPLASLAGPIAVIIPARNEAEVIGRAIASLLRQSCAESLHIFVVDDHSSDGTAEVARNAAARCLRPDAVTVLTAARLPLGWSGKVWAVQQGVEQALLLKPRFLLLTDADIEHSPENIATLIAVAERGSYDLASFMVKLHCRSFAEKLLIPAFVFFFFLLYPPEWIRDPHRKIAGDAGLPVGSSGGAGASWRPRSHPGRGHR